MNKAHITPINANIHGSIRPPGSKSITNRALVCAALAHGTSDLHGVLDSEDTRVMIEAWKQLGLETHYDMSHNHLSIVGCAGKLKQQQARIFVGNSGTTIRFLTAALATCSGCFVLDGVPRMRQRPIGDLIDALTQLGANIHSLNAEDRNCPPLEILANGLKGGVASVAGNISSQFLSALMMAAPMAAQSVQLNVSGELVSMPYVRMTAEVMKSFGASVVGTNSGPFLIDNRRPYCGTQYNIEPDASAASYFWAAAAICGGSAIVRGLDQDSLQGDVRFCEVLRQMGCEVEYRLGETEVKGATNLVGVDVNMSDISDTVQSLAAVALFANGPTTVRGVQHNRVKETDRISDLARELIKLGAKVDEFSDGLRIHPPNELKTTDIETYHDHRMAMSLALVGLRHPITILDPGCTAKTYPDFWRDLANFSGSRIVME